MPPGTKAEDANTPSGADAPNTNIDDLVTELADAREQASARITELEAELADARKVAGKVQVEKVFTAKRSFAVMHKDQRVYVHTGETTEEGHWLLKAQPDAFKPFTVNHPRD